MYGLDCDETEEWIFNKIIPKLGTQHSFNFGLYLARYAMYEMKKQEKLSQRYVDFLNKQVGITWNII